MHRVLPFALLLLLPPSTALGQEKPKLPEGTPPRLVTVVDIKGDVIVYRDFFSMGPGLSPFPKETGPIDTKKLTPARPMFGPTIPCAVEFSFKEGTVYDVKGNKLSAETVKKRLGIGDTVLVSTTTKTVDPGYLRVVNQEALIFVHPPAKPGPALPLP
jgi:hypothetical protein